MSADVSLRVLHWWAGVCVGSTIVWVASEMVVPVAFEITMGFWAFFGALGIVSWFAR